MSDNKELSAQLTDAEVVCALMEARPELPLYWSGVRISDKGWWILVRFTGGGMKWFPNRSLEFDALHIVKALAAVLRTTPTGLKGDS